MQNGTEQHLNLSEKRNPDSPRVQVGLVTNSGRNLILPLLLSVTAQVKSLKAQKYINMSPC